MTYPDIILEPIGSVKNGITHSPEQGWEETVSEVIINEEWIAALEGIDGFSHIVVLFWMHTLSPDERFTTQVHPQRRPDIPLVGVFATRSPVRPNPIGLAVTRLLNRHDNRLKVKGLDALDGSPVLDIKPYLCRGDRIEDSQIPWWIEKLWS